MGLFITCEGGEGAGKTTLLQLLEDKCKENHLPYIRTREPGGTEVGESIRSILLHHKGFVSNRTELALFLASRAQHVEEKILPALKQDKIVLCDRFSDSSIAYQGMARDFGMERVEDLCLFFTNSLNPDITFYLDIDPKVGFERIRKKSQDRMETQSLEFHQKVREGFHLLAKKYPSRFCTIDATLSKEQIFAIAWNVITKRLAC
ncbi:MAG: dTMP kinase [Chlamydiota bacterium]